MAAKQSNADAEPTWKDSATVEGDHKQVADMAVTLHEAGKRVKLSHGNFTTELYEGDDYWIKHNDGSTYIMTEGLSGDRVHQNVTDDHSLYVTERR